ncbi:hypothetical protein M1N64_00930 [Peptococcaceae bacterium]|nr:hypothetical protein [Peptococcaceae bacterium]
MITIAQMTKDELRELIETSIEQKLLELLGDPVGAKSKKTFRKDKRINIRLSQKKLESIQRKALEEGIPYQTLISSLIHKYVNNRLIEKS